MEEKSISANGREGSKAEVAAATLSVAFGSEPAGLAQQHSLTGLRNQSLLIEGLNPAKSRRLHTKML